LRGVTRRACSSPRGRRPPRGWIPAAFESRVPIPKQFAHANWGRVAVARGAVYDQYMHVHFQYLHSLVRNEHIARIRRTHMAPNAGPTALLSILRRWLPSSVTRKLVLRFGTRILEFVFRPRARALAQRRSPWCPLGTRPVADYDPTLSDHALNTTPLLRMSGGYPQPPGAAQIHKWFSVAPPRPAGDSVPAKYLRKTVTVLRCVKYACVRREAEKTKKTL